MEILTYPNKLLRRISEEVTIFDEKLNNLAQELSTCCKKRLGLGMAAPQIGEAIRLVVVNTTLDKINNKYPQYLVNPKITNCKGQSKFKEGCLSVPKVFAWVDRANSFELSYQDLDGESHTLRVEDTSNDLFGTVIQHEVDHLDGIEFVDKLSIFEKNKILPALAKLRRKAK